MQLEADGGPTALRLGRYAFRLIRGTDFARRPIGPCESGVPRRYEDAVKSERRSHSSAVTIVLCRSRAAARPAVDQLGAPSCQRRGPAGPRRPGSPASFCRLVRSDAAKIDTRYAYYVLQDMHLISVVALLNTEHRSTGSSVTVQGLSTVLEPTETIGGSSRPSPNNAPSPTSLARWTTRSS